MALPPSRQPTKSRNNGERSDVIQTLEADEFNQDWAQNSGLTARSTQALQSVGVLRTWTDGQVLLSRGQPTSAAWLVVSGRVRVSVIRWILPGEIGGLSSVFAKASNPVDMVSHGMTQVLLIERARLIELIGRDPLVALDLLRILGLRINQLFDNLADQGMHSLELRVWASLERIAKYNSTVVPDGVMLRVSQSDLAQASSASRQRVNQQLRHFQEQGLIRLGYRNIVLLRKNSKR